VFIALRLRLIVARRYREPLILPARAPIALVSLL
jgi:hypothetical protein